jgi:hypothetical protein
MAAMSALAQIVEMDRERDRKACIALDLKITGANHELAQWIANKRGTYTIPEIARWLGTSESRITRLRKWAEGGFVGGPHDDDTERRKSKPPLSVEDSLKTNDNSESDDGSDDDDSDDSEIAAPEQIEDNILYAIQRINENAGVFTKILKASALDREAVARIDTAIDRMMGKWRSIQSMLEKKVRRDAAT